MAHEKFHQASTIRAIPRRVKEIFWGCLFPLILNTFPLSDLDETCYTIHFRMAFVTLAFFSISTPLPPGWFEHFQYPSTSTSLHTPHAHPPSTPPFINSSNPNMTPLILGDFNAHHPSWCSQTSDTRAADWGTDIHDSLTNFDLILLNTELPNPPPYQRLPLLSWPHNSHPPHCHRLRVVSLSTLNFDHLPIQLQSNPSPTGQCFFCNLSRTPTSHLH